MVTDEVTLRLTANMAEVPPPDLSPTVPVTALPPKSRLIPAQLVWGVGDDLDLGDVHPVGRVEGRLHDRSRLIPVEGAGAGARVGEGHAGATTSGTGEQASPGEEAESGQEDSTGGPRVLRVGVE
jgi:hypothetical protein